jgi:hypothetical protein
MPNAFTLDLLLTSIPDPPTLRNAKRTKSRRVKGVGFSIDLSAVAVLSLIEVQELEKQT